MQQDGTRCGLDTPYEFLVKTPEGAVNQKELVLEFFGGGARSDFIDRNCHDRVDCPVLVASGISAMRITLSEASRFPNLERIYVVGESAGGWATFAWTREAIRQPSWSLADFLVEASESSTGKAALESMGGRMSFGIFTRSADADQLLYWRLFGGDPSVWTGRMASLVNEMEQRLPPALLRSYVVNGSTHGMHRREELWTMEYQGVKFRDWLGNLSNCWVPVESMRVWDPLVGSKGTYGGDDENVHTCTTTTTTVTWSMSAAATVELCMPLLAATAFTTVGALFH
eukprot:s1489_g9.t1